MTQEEKARAYDEALERAKTLYENANGMILKKWVEQVFPELAESEDEKIRKRLITDFGTIGKKEWGGLEVKDILAWLERQGEQIATANKEYWRGYREGKKLILDKYAEVKKQCEQKFEMKTAEESLGIDSDTYNKIVDECIFGEQKSEENKGNIGGISSNSAWNEEDEQHIDSLLKRLDSLCRNKFERTRFAISEDREWLKSLRPQNRWKPSDEQMMALLYHCSNGSVLTSLYNDLNKLKEE